MNSTIVSITMSATIMINIMSTTTIMTTTTFPIGGGIGGRRAL